MYEIRRIMCMQLIVLWLVIFIIFDNVFVCDCVPVFLCFNVKFVFSIFEVYMFAFSLLVSL